MSVSQPALYLSTPDLNTWNSSPRQSQSLEERLLNKKRRLEVKKGRKTKELDQYTPFFVPDRLLENDRHKTTQPQCLLLHKLPTELLLLTVEHLSIPYFQVCFALTCKSIATIFSQNRLRISTWRGWWDKEGLYRLLTQPERPLPNSTSLGQGQLSLQRLSISDNDPHLRSIPSSLSQPYIPCTYRLCRACFRHVPRDPIYWQSKMRSKEYDDPSVNWFDITNFFEEGYRNCGQHKCPDCCVKGYVAFMNKEAYEKALWEDNRDQEWGFDLDGGDKPRRVCPSLAARLGRP